MKGTGRVSSTEMKDISLHIFAAHTAQIKPATNSGVVLIKAHLSETRILLQPYITPGTIKLF